MSVVAPFQAIADTIYRRVCPLYSFDEAGRIHVVGSAVPFKTKALSFLISAAHVCLNGWKQPVPLFTWGSAGPRVLKGTRLAWEYLPNVTPDCDIALIALSPEDEADLDAYYQFTEPDATATVKPKRPHLHYMVTGYPAAGNRVRRLEQSLPGVATYLVTGDILEVAALDVTDKTDEHHLALHFPHKEVTTPIGTTFRVPKPAGMSGGGIWRLEIDPVTRLASTPQLVGIGIEYHRSSSVFVGTRVQVAIPLAHNLLEIIHGCRPDDVIELRSSHIMPNNALQR